MPEFANNKGLDS